MKLQELFESKDKEFGSLAAWENALPTKAVVAVRGALHVAKNADGKTIGEYDTRNEQGWLTEGRLKEAKGEYSSFASWKAAIKKKHPDAWIDGDKDIASAMVGPKPYKHGETKGVGEWDGAKGELYESKVHADHFGDWKKSAWKLAESTKGVSLGERGSFNVDGKPVSYMHWDRFGSKKFFFYATQGGDRERIEIPSSMDVMKDLPKWVEDQLATAGENVDKTGRSRF